MRSRRIGRARWRLPVACQTALAIAAAVPPIANIPSRRRTRISPVAGSVAPTATVNVPSSSGRDRFGGRECDVEERGGGKAGPGQKRAFSPHLRTMVAGRPPEPASAFAKAWDEIAAGERKARDGTDV